VNESWLHISIGTDALPAPDFMSVGWGPGAEVPFCPGEGLPCPDGIVDVIVCGESVPELPAALLLHLLLDCRRVLRPEGVLSVVLPSRRREVALGVVPIAEDDLLRLTSLLGLEAAQSAPVAAHGRAVMARLPRASADSIRFEFTKRNREVVGDPLVSILIPAYSGRFFAACLDSALAQTYPNVEIVVCDDAPDSTIEALVGARVGRRPIRYLRNPVRLGVRANYRRCFEEARGEFVKFLCDDDLLAPTCVARLLDAFRRTPDVTLATSHRQRIDANGDRLGEQPATIPIVGTDTLIAGYTLLNAMLMAGLNVVGEPSTTLFRKADLLSQAPDYFCFDGVPGHGIIDMVTWSALLLRGDAVYLRESLSCFRIHPGQRQHDPAKMRRNIDSIRSLQSRWLTLGLHERMPRDQLLVKPFPPSDGGGWQSQIVRTLPLPQFVQTQWTFTQKARSAWG
jgi:glycosyltransferase involved in cell wall biosynthesis